MDADPAEDRSNVAVLQPAAAPSEATLVHTRESIDPQVAIAVYEIDPQSTQYSCEVTVTNIADEAFDVVDVSPRLPKGVRLNESVDSAEVELVKLHGEVCRAIGSIMTEAFRNSLKPKSLFGRSWRAVSGGSPAWLKAARDRNLEIEIQCAEDAEWALKKFGLEEDSLERKIVEFNIERLKKIEKHEDYDCRCSHDVTLKKGQQYKSLYVVSAKRGRLSPNTYSLSFDVTMRRGDYSLSRVEYTTLPVPTGHLWTTVVAMASAIIGGLILKLQPHEGAAATAPGRNPLDKIMLDIGAAAPDIVVSLLTAAIVYNIFDMTVLKEKVSSSRNWRTAVFVGFLCGFLNMRILQALSALLG